MPVVNAKNILRTHLNPLSFERSAYDPLLNAVGESVLTSRTFLLHIQTLLSQEMRRWFLLEMAHTEHMNSMLIALTSRNGLLKRRDSQQ